MAWFIFPIAIAITAIPCFLIYAGYSYWANNPSRLENIAKKHTWQLYEEAKARVDNPLEIEQAFEMFNNEVTEEQQETYQFLRRVFLGLWRYEGYQTELKPPTNTLQFNEGGKYRDSLNNLNFNKDSLIRAVTMTSLVLANPRMTQDIARILGNLIVNNADGDCLYPKPLHC